MWGPSLEIRDSRGDANGMEMVAGHRSGSDCHSPMSLLLVPEHSQGQAVAACRGTGDFSGFSIINFSFFTFFPPLPFL